MPSEAEIEAAAKAICFEAEQFRCYCKSAADCRLYNKPMNDDYPQLCPARDLAEVALRAAEAVREKEAARTAKTPPAEPTG